MAAGENFGVIPSTKPFSRQIHFSLWKDGRNIMRMERGTDKNLCEKMMNGIVTGLACGRIFKIKNFNLFYGQSHGGFNYMMANRKMEFALAGRPFVKFKGDGIGITNSYKMPEEIADQLAPDTSFKIQWNYGEDRRVPMPTFCAV